MFQNLHIQGYRRFKDYRLENLARVNLLVGDNNSGKTSVLEAVHFLFSDDPHWVLWSTAERRGEQTELLFKPSRTHHTPFPLLTHFFTGHKLEFGQRLTVETENDSRTLEIVPDRVLAPEAEGPNDLTARVTSKATNSRPEVDIPVNRNGAFGSTTVGTWNPEAGKSPSVDLLIGEIHGLRLREMWDRLIQSRREGLVIEALRIVDDGILDLHFDATVTDPANPRVGVRFGHRDNPQRLPLGTLGDGVVRLLGMAVMLVNNRQGTFLIDEIDTGLHWSILGDVWRMIIETAKSNNTQVFATTHSEDCIKGLASVCSQHPELAEEVSVQSLKTALDFSVSVTGDRLPFVVGQEIEVR